MNLLDAVRIPSARRRFNEFPFQYSGGMLQRAMIVDALVARPAIIIADNIVQPLDVTVAAQIVRLLRELRDTHRGGHHLHRQLACRPCARSPTRSRC